MNVVQATCTNNVPKRREGSRTFRPGLYGEQCFLLQEKMTTTILSVYTPD